MAYYWSAKITFAIKNKKPLPYNKAYFFHGGHVGGAGQIGEERVAKYFESKGYKIIRGHEVSSAGVWIG